MGLTLSIVLIGLSGIIAEVLILREFLNVFLGNELTVGLVLSGWLVSEAAGSWVAEKVRSWDRSSFFVLFQLAFALSVPATVFSIRLSRYIVGVSFGETFPLPYMLFLPLSLPFISSFSHGALFTLCCNLTGSGGRTYAYETLGTVLGSLLTTYLLLGRFPVHFSLMVIVTATLLSAALVVKSKVLAILFLLSPLLVFPLRIGNKMSTKLKWNPQKVLISKDSPYGRIVVTESHGQKTVFIDGVSVVSVPEPDIQSLELFVYPVFLSSPSCREVLILGGGTGELIREVANFPDVDRITLVEIDPQVVEVSLKTMDLGRFIQKGKLSVVIDDARRFLKRCLKSGKKYDIIISNVGEPSSLQSVRLLTGRFFELCKLCMGKKGVLTFRMPSSFPYMINEVARVNLSAYISLKKAFHQVYVIPGECENIFIGSGRPINLNPEALSREVALYHLKPRFFSLPVISYRMGLKSWFMDSIKRVKAAVSTDTRPTLLYYYLLLWTAEYSPRFEGVLSKTGAFIQSGHGIYFLLVSFVFFLVVLLIFSYAAGKAKAVGSCFIFLTGFQGMVVSLSILFLFQVVHGYMYSDVGVLMGLFMAGVMAGSLASEKSGKYFHSGTSILALDLSIALFGVFLWKVLSSPSWYMAPPSLFYVLSFISGCFTGVEFPAVSRFVRENTGVDISGSLYASDLLGGCVAGILGSCLMLPVLGLGPTILVTSVLKILIWMPSALMLQREGSS